LQAALGDGGDTFGRFLAVYKQAGGIQSLHVDHFAFYLLRRYLGDMTVRLVSIVEKSIS
jgi:hypothetical protein